MITRTLINSERPLVAPNGDVLANVEITFQLVDEDKRQPVMLMDAAPDGGNLVVGEVITATTDDNGLFTVDLWPNNRGEMATLYKVSLPSTRISPFPAARLKPFYIKVVEGSTPLQLVEAKTAVEAASPQVLSLFDQLLQNILDVVGQATALVTATANGLMASADKTKLDSLTAPLACVSKSIGGGAIAAGASITTTESVAGATVGMAVAVSPVTFPGDGIIWSAYVSAAGVVTITVTAVKAVASSTASAYNVRVIQ